MASETEEMSASSFIERLISSRNRDLSLFLPFIFGFTSSRSEPDPDQDLENPDQETRDSSQPGSPSGGSRDRIILINPLTQGMVVIEGSSSGLDALLDDLMRKDGQPPASKASIDAMPTVEVKDEGDIESLGGECVICLEEWGVGDVAKEMPCKHKFHGGCVEKWLKIHGSCPVCRYKMPVEEDQDFNKKVGDEGERGERRRREIWVTFSFSGRNNSERSSEQQVSNQESITSNESSSS